MLEPELTNTLQRRLIRQVTEFAAIKIFVCLHDFLPGIHYKRAIGSNRFVDGLTAQH
jgi:hypothetical protein